MSAMSIQRKWLIAAISGIALVAIIVGAVLTSRDETPAPRTSGDSAATTTSVEATGKAHPATPQVPGGPVTSGDATRATPAKPTVVKPPEEGAELVTITVPPVKTLAMISTANVSAGSTYMVEFRPYGVGPDRGGIATLVISVTSSKANAPAGQKTYDFKGRNVLVSMTPQATSVVASGGTYRGVITLRKSGDVLIPWLDDVGSAS